MNSELYQKLQAKAEQARRNQTPPFEPDVPIELYVDGLCENPGAMHIGLYAKQGERVLFAEHLAVGNGTCNEAEYIAVKSGLTLLQIAFPQPAIPVQVSSDSQLVVRQVNGEWRASGQMLVYCVDLRKFRKTYPFVLKKVPREQNQIADSLAQKYITKNSGRCLTIDHGRFNISKLATASVKKGDLYNALMTEEAKKYFDQYSLRESIKELRQLVAGGERHAAVKVACEIQEKSVDLMENAPKSNAILGQWMENTLALIQKVMPQIIQAIESGNNVDFLYCIEEMTGGSDSPNEHFSCMTDIIENQPLVRGGSPPCEDEDEEVFC